MILPPVVFLGGSIGVRCVIRKREGEDRCLLSVICPVVESGMSVKVSSVIDHRTVFACVGGDMEKKERGRERGQTGELRKKLILIVETRKERF